MKYSPTTILKRFQQGVQQQSSGLLQPQVAEQQQPHLLSSLRSGSSMSRNFPFETGFTSSAGTDGSDFSDEKRMKNKSNKI